MKSKVILPLIIFCGLFAVKVKAQDDLGIDDSPYTEKYAFIFSCPSLEGSQITGKWGISLGANAGVLINKKLFIGAYATKLSNSSKTFRVNNYLCT